MWSLILSILLSLTGLFLMFIVLLQRGRGGGLAGAFGGLGGQSAFGTKAGDVFTKITIVVAAVWILLAGGTGIAMWQESEGRFPGGEQVEPAVQGAGGENANEGSNGADGLGDLDNLLDEPAPTNGDDSAGDGPIFPGTDTPDTSDTDNTESEDDEANGGTPENDAAAPGGDAGTGGNVDQGTPD